MGLEGIGGEGVGPDSTGTGWKGLLLVKKTPTRVEVL